MGTRLLHLCNIIQSSFNFEKYLFCGKCTFAVNGMGGSSLLLAILYASNSNSGASILGLRSYGTPCKTNLTFVQVQTLLRPSVCAFHEKLLCFQWWWCLCDDHNVSILAFFYVTTMVVVTVVSVCSHSGIGVTLLLDQG